MATRQLQGWCADPFQLHEERYFSSGRPTKLVRDGKVECYEDPPSDTYETAAPRTYPPGGAPPRTGVTGQYAYGPAAQQVRDRQARRRSHALLVTAAIAIVAATVAGMFVLVKQESHATPANPNRPTAISQDAFVRQSAAKTLAERAANLTLSGTVQSAGRTQTINGTGGINFGANSMQLNLSVGSPGQVLTETEILVNGNLYLTYAISGLTPAKLTGGRDWIEMPTSQSGSASSVGSDPVSSLSLLEQQGINVREIGTKVIEGESSTGYAITPTKAAMLASVRAEFTKLGYSPAMIDQEVTLAQDTLPPTVTVWIDAQGLMREMSMNLGVQTVGPSGAVSGSLVIYLSYLGSPVQVTAPPAADTISYASFLNAAAGSQA